MARVGAVSFAPPDGLYRAWWDSTAQCLRIHAPYDSTVVWFVGMVLPKHFQDCRAPGTVGCALHDGHAVLLAPGWQADRRIVTHELLHLWIGHGGHPGRYFTDRCGTK